VTVPYLSIHLFHWLGIRTARAWGLCGWAGARRQSSGGHSSRWSGSASHGLSPGRRIPHLTPEGLRVSKEPCACDGPTFTIPVSDLDGSIRFLTQVCAWPSFAIVASRAGEPSGSDQPRPKGRIRVRVVAGPWRSTRSLDHFGFQCERREEVRPLRSEPGKPAARRRSTDHGGSVGYFAVVREPSGHSRGIHLRDSR